MMVRILLIMFLYFGVTQSSYACETNMLGDSLNELAGDYDVDDMFEPVDGGELEVLMRGNVYCSKLPSTSRAIFTFIDNEMVNINIRNPGNTNVLLDFIEDKFGEAVLKKDLENSSNPYAQYYWADDEKYVVFYSLHKENGKFFEHIDITSREDKDLFHKVYKDKEDRS